MVDNDKIKSKSIILIKIFDLSIKIWSNLIEDRLILIEKRSMRFNMIWFRHQILNRLISMFKFGQPGIRIINTSIWKPYSPKLISKQVFMDKPLNLPRSLNFGTQSLKALALLEKGEIFHEQRTSLDVIN